VVGPQNDGSVPVWLNVRRRPNYARSDYRSKNQTARPDILVRPKVEHFAVLDSFLASRILRAAEGGNEELKLTLEEMKAHATA
jgi:hypothetical protein